MLRRREARKDLLSYAQYVQPHYRAGNHHRVICDALMKLEQGEIDRLMIFAPPRHGKSQLASKHFPAWYLGRNPSDQIITATYSAEFAADFGRDVRNTLRENEYRRLFKTELRDDSQSANRWHTTDGGVYVSVGIGGATTGRGASIALLDDVHKNREEAESEVMRERVWNWYTSTLYTRLMPGGKICLILTRWHEADLAGKLLEQQEKGGDKWHVINLQAISNEDEENEEALWPEWYPLESLKRIRSAIGPRDWNALYQQNPQPDSGTFYQREWFKRYEPGKEPTRLNRYITSDFAVTADAGDSTEHAVWGIDADDNLYAIDWWHGQTTADVWIDTLIDKWAAHKPLCWFGEGGVIRRSIEPFLIKRTRERKTYCRMEWISSAHDKPTRARGFQARAAMGKVFIPATPWGERLINQLVSFPTGANDDAVDACSLMANALDQAHPAIVPTVEEVKKRDGWNEAFNNDDDGPQTWRTT